MQKYQKSVSPETKLFLIINRIFSIIQIYQILVCKKKIHSICDFITDHISSIFDKIIKH